MTPAIVPIIATDLAISSPADPPSCSWLGTTWDFYFNRDAWKQCQVAKGQAQIQHVADNAAYYYGPDSPTAQVAQAAADQQKAQVPADVENVAEYYKAGSLVAQPDQGMPTWVMAALLVGGFLLLKNMNQ